MRRRPASVGGFFAATNSGKNFDFLRDLLEEACSGRPETVSKTFCLSVMGSS